MKNDEVKQSSLKGSKELALHYMTTLVEVARESFLILDSDLRVVSANPTFYQNFKVLPEKTENILLYELGNGQWNIPSLKILLEAILPDKEVVKDYEVKHTFQTIGEKTILLNAREINIDTVQMIVLAFEDITIRKNLEDKLAEYTKELEVKVAEKTKDLEEKENVRREMAKTAEQLALKAKELAVIAKEKEDVRKKLVVTTDKLIRQEKLAVLGKLAGIMGHEIRNPLGVIRNSIYFLTMKFQGSMDEKVKRHMDILENEIDGCDKIISDVLDFARIRPSSFAETEINSVVKASLSKTSIPKTVKVQTNLGENLPKLNIDRAQIQQVFSNIISNAIEAMPKGGELQVSTSQTDTFISIAFKDTGVGISKENTSKLFEPLFSTKPKGLGLGLATCQNIISAHHGKIEFESQEGQGTTLTVTLPIYESTHDLTVGVSSLDRASSDSGKPTTSQSGFYRDKN